MAEGARLESVCAVKVPRVRIPLSPPLKVIVGTKTPYGTSDDIQSISSEIQTSDL